MKEGTVPLQSSPLKIANRIVLSNEEAKPVPSVKAASLTEDDRRNLRTLVLEGIDPSSGVLTIRRNRSHTVGQLTLRDVTIVVPPTIKGSLFMTLLLTAIGSHNSRRVQQFIREFETESGLAPEVWASYFDVLLAYLYVRWTEGILAAHVAQSYIRRDERLHVLKGRPAWNRDMGQHRAEGIHCSYFQLETDNMFNRLILAGLVRAAAVLRGTDCGERVHNQLFIWRSLARVTVPHADTFDLAYGKINRLTEHYRPVLRLGEALLFGHAPRDPFSGGSQWLQGFHFSVPRLYEQFLAHILREFLAPYRLTVQEQRAHRGAFVDALNRRYRRVQPDIVIFEGERPIAIIDAKYKPQYVQGGGQALLPDGNKVSSEDLYQMFFYQAHIQSIYGSRSSIPSALVSPRLPGAEPIPAPALRKIRWKAAGTPDEHALRVLPLPLEHVLEALSEGISPRTALNKAEELVAFLAGIVPSTSKLVALPIPNSQHP